MSQHTVPTDAELRDFLRTEARARVTSDCSDDDYIARVMSDPQRKRSAAFHWRISRAQPGEIIELPEGVSLADEELMQTAGPLGPLDEFDAAFRRVTVDRGAVYGHPVENFSRIQALKAVVRECPDEHAREALEEICVKMARLIASPDHVDSWLDIAGYARTAVMCIDRKRGMNKPDAFQEVEEYARTGALPGGERRMDKGFIYKEAADLKGGSLL